MIPPKPTDPTTAEYIVSFSALYQRPGQKSTIKEDTISVELEAGLKGKELLVALKKSILKESFKDIRMDNLKKLIILNLYKS